MLCEKRRSYKFPKFHRKTLVLMFSCEICEISRTHFLKNICKRLLPNRSAFIEAVARRCSVKKLSQPQACNFIKKETLTQMFSCEFREISKNTNFYRTPLVVASVCRILSNVNDETFAKVVND